MDAEFERLMSICEGFSRDFPDGLVFIGGVAIFLHAHHSEKTRPFAEATHDGDFFVSLNDLADLRDIEEVTANRRLNKHQLVKDGFEFDIYTEHQSGLPISYASVQAHSVAAPSIKVACLEHLLVLKMAAFVDRGQSSKGGKDARDLLRLALLFQERIEPINTDLVLPYWDEKEIQLLCQLPKGPWIVSMAQGNTHVARDIRRAINTLSETLVAVDKQEPAQSARTSPSRPKR